MKVFVFLLLLSTAFSVNAKSIFYVGHSLIGKDMPVMIDQIAASMGKSSSHTRQTIPGAPLKYNYTRCEEKPKKVCATKVLKNSPYDVLVITEGIPLGGKIHDPDPSDQLPGNTYQYALQYYELQQLTNPGGEVFLFETWHCINSGTAIGCKKIRKTKPE